LARRRTTPCPQLKQELLVVYVEHPRISHQKKSKHRVEEKKIKVSRKLEAHMKSKRVN
jgi:inorganic pyrophosphatase